ncbi:transcriptional regulator [Paenibacillus oralis]|uniref:Transcriptional regulator n=1 Tax=Paenibacillus oralis TaxID=2490856 RepID=A0A3P3UBY2_9BACL|nr:transcriptional regulator [Paenibacillus oralis]
MFDLSINRFQKIALLLAKEDYLCFTAVGERLGSVTGSTLSHHLKQLTDSGLIDFRFARQFFMKIRIKAHLNSVPFRIVVIEAIRKKPDSVL